MCGPPPTPPSTSPELHYLGGGCYVAPMTDQSPHDDRPVVVADNRSRVSLSRHTSTKPGQMFFLDFDEETGIISLTPARAVPIGTLGFDDPTAD